MKKNNAKWVVILLIAVLIAVVVDIAVRFSVPDKSKQPSRCLEIPIKFAMENPDCANKLTEAANLTNIHIVPPGTSNTIRANRIRLTAKP